MSIKDIKIAVCIHYRIGLKDMLSPSRLPEYVLPRHVAMYLCHKEGYSYPQIAHHFNRKCHTTVMHAVKKIMATERKILD